MPTVLLDGQKNEIEKRIGEIEDILRSVNPHDRTRHEVWQAMQAARAAIRPGLTERQRRN
jgi:hypothetical protein